MKKLSPFLFFLFVTHISLAQNWNCFVPGTKQFFTNSNNYLRGIRIDSVVTSGTDNIYYPFRSIRGYINQVKAIDTNGGSWLGKQVLQKADGTFLFDNIWGDTVIINTQASLGDTWTFYSDTSAVYYVAAITSVGTASVLGTTDSIKNISITAYSGANIISNNPINNLSIVLSKNHGFAKAIDLYTFPYLVRDSSLNDYYFYMLQGVHGLPPFSTMNTLPYAIGSKQEFNQVSFHYPSLSEIYSYEIGDIISSQHSDIAVSHISESTEIDTIISKSVTASGVSYIGNMGDQNYYSSAQTGSHYSPITSGTYSLQYTNTALLFDSTKMPEEWKALYAYYFNPNDSTNCFVSETYEFDPSYVCNYSLLGAGFPSWFEYCGIETNIYKVGIGPLDLESYQGNPASNSNPDCESYLTKGRACVKGGIACGTCPSFVLGVKNIAGAQDFIEAYPNPANDELLIKLPNTASNCRISLVNLLGKTVYSTQAQQQEVTIFTFQLPDGVYILKVADENGITKSKKMLIQH